MEKNKIIEFGCWRNSHIIALSKDIDGIDVVNGYYGYNYKDALKSKIVLEDEFKTEEEILDVKGIIFVSLFNLWGLSISLYLLRQFFLINLSKLSKSFCFQ